MSVIEPAGNINKKLKTLHNHNLFGTEINIKVYCDISDYHNDISIYKLKKQNPFSSLKKVELEGSSL